MFEAASRVSHLRQFKVAGRRMCLMPCHAQPDCIEMHIKTSRGSSLQHVRVASDKEKLLQRRKQVSSKRDNSNVDLCVAVEAERLSLHLAIRVNKLVALDGDETRVAERIGRRTRRSSAGPCGHICCGRGRKHGWHCHSSCLCACSKCKDDRHGSQHHRSGGQTPWAWAMSMHAADRQLLLLCSTRPYSSDRWQDLFHSGQKVTSPCHVWQKRRCSRVAAVRSGAVLEPIQQNSAEVQ